MGDAITAIGGKPVDSPGAVRVAVEFVPIGEPLALGVARDGKAIDIEVKPTSIPDDPRPEDR